MQSKPFAWVALAVLTVSLFLGSRSAAFVQQKDDVNELPRSWSMKEIAEAAPPYGFEEKSRVYVLAWQIVQDKRPLRVETCLVMRVLNKDDGNGSWCASHLYRHPDDKKPEWRLSRTHVSGEKGTKYYPGLMVMHYKRFTKRPTNKDLYASFSVEDLNWSFELEKGYRFVGCGVREKSWQEVLGEKPTRFFGN